MLAIAAGSSASSGDFTADRDFMGGTPYLTTLAIDTSHVSNPAPSAVYDNCRYGNFSYALPGLVPGNTYLVRLHFAEIYWAAAGKRVFNVAVNGSSVLNNFDLWTASGGEAIAIVKEFPAIADSGGTINVQFTSVVDNAMVNGIEVVNSIPATPIVRMSADKASYHVGDQASLTILLKTKPNDSDEEFDTTSTVDGLSVATMQETSSVFFVSYPVALSGPHIWQTTLFLQNARFAHDLKITMSKSSAAIAADQKALQTVTDPTQISQLQADLAHQQSLLASSRAALANIRTIVGQNTFTFSAN
ncbi:MAG: malectin domain-containing carbohydrate-binding protein [Bdellovibrionota bacterium]